MEFVAHHFGLSVPNLEASIKWYQEILGFALERKMAIADLHAQIAWMKYGDFRIELFEMENGQPLPDDRRYPDKDLLTHGWKHLSIGVTNVRQTFDYLKSKGVEIAMESQVAGNDMGFIRDNAGNLIEINKAGAP